MKGGEQLTGVWKKKLCWLIHVYYTEYINACGTTNTWRKTQRSVCIEPSSLPPLLYGSESWGIHLCQLWLLKGFYQHWLCTIPNIHWCNMVTNVEVYEKENITSIEDMLLEYPLCWVDYISWMRNHHLLKTILCGMLSACHHDRGPSKKGIQGLLGKVFWWLSHWPSLIVHPSWHLTTRRYRHRKWTRWHEFKSWTRLIAFHIALIPLGKVWIQLFSLQLWVNSRTD